MHYLMIVLLYRQVFNIILMLPYKTPTRNLKPIKTQQAQDTINHSYTIYTPNILTFSYHPTTSRKSSQLDFTNNSTQLHPSNKFGLKIKVLAKDKHQNKSMRVQNQQLKPMKISLICNRKSHREAFKSDRVLQSRFSMQSQPAKMVELPNHISVGNFIESVSCDIFSQCNDLSQVDQGQRKPLPYVYNHKTVEKVEQEIRLQMPKDLKKKENEENPKDKSFVESDINFRRKNIFSISRPLNTTVDLSFQQPLRSKSKKSIFKPREKSTGKAAKDFSIGKRKNIFQEAVETSPRFGVKCIQQTLQQSDIPNNILESWEQFSESSQLWSENSFSGVLGVVKELGLEQSKASIMK